MLPWVGLYNETHLHDVVDTTSRGRGLQIGAGKEVRQSFVTEVVLNRVLASLWRGGDGRGAGGELGVRGEDAGRVGVGAASTSQMRTSNGGT